MALPSPTFYEPWKEFGLAALSVAEIQGRVDEYLGSLVRRV